MGLMDRLLGGDSDKSDEYDEWDEEAEDDELDDEWDEDWDEDEAGDDEDDEWDTPYQFLDEMLQHRGFGGANEFTKKAMVYRINRSPLFRDRIKVGNQTMQMVNNTMQMQEEMFGGGSGSNYGQLAEELEEGKRLIDAVEEFGPDEESQLAWEITGLASDFFEVWADRQGGATGAVASQTKSSDEPL